VNLKEYLTKEKPSLSASSTTTYSSTLTSLYKKVFDDKTIEMEKFKETEPILKYLQDIPFNKRKTILSVLLLVSPNEKKYRDLMLEDIHTYNDEQNKQIKNEKQEYNWVDSNEIEKKWETLKKNAMILYKKQQKTVQDYQEIQSFILLSLLGGLFTPPRRAKDFTDFKIKNIDKTKDNYIDKNQMIFNSFKTAKFYGEQKVLVSPELKKILTKWISVNPTDYLFFDSFFQPLSSVKLFDNKRISVNALRHSYLSNKYQNTIETNKELENDLTGMGSSILQQKVSLRRTDKISQRPVTCHPRQIGS
jgi:integrase